MKTSTLNFRSRSERLLVVGEIILFCRALWVDSIHWIGAFLHEELGGIEELFSLDVVQCSMGQDVSGDIDVGDFRLVFHFI